MARYSPIDGRSVSCHFTVIVDSVLDKTQTDGDDDDDDDDDDEDDDEDDDRDARW